MALSLEVSRTGDIAVVRRPVTGSSLGKKADEIRGLILSLLKETNRIVLNLAWVVYMDSSGSGTLVASFISVRHRAELKSNMLSYRPEPDDCYDHKSRSAI